MVDYVEDPWNLIVNVGWETKPLPTVLKLTQSGFTIAHALSGCSLSTIVDAGNTYIGLAFQITSSQRYWRDDLTVSELINATFKGEDSGATFKMTDHISSFHCSTTGGLYVTRSIYAEGGTKMVTIGPDTFTARARMADVNQLLPSLTYGVIYYSNSSITGYDPDAFSTWINGEEFTATGL